VEVEVLCSWSNALIGLVGGFISTTVMTLTEIPSWKRWGPHGVFEWHENQILSNHLLRHFFNYSGRKEKKTTIHFKGIFLLHFLNGTIAGIAYPFLFYSVVSYLGISDFALIYMIGILYGIILWLLTPVPIHKPITGFSPWNHPVGRLPALASLGGHVVYGIVLGLFVETIAPR
jgi:hypothetical protein